jgi:predicted CopG family antitoxin
MTKTISLSDEAYGVLRRYKLAGEGFSDAVLRLARHGGKLSEVIVSNPKLRGTGLARAVRENRRRLAAAALKEFRKQARKARITEADVDRAIAESRAQPP